MILDVERANKSNKYFEQIIPILQHYFGGKVISTENHNSEVEAILDFQCGIDGLVLTEDTVFGIAHRVSYLPYHTFTIRTKDLSGKLTEIDHIKRSGIKPRFHVQTVCVNDKPTIMAIAKTADLVYAINHHMYTTKTAFSGDKFAVLDWDYLINNGINIDIINL